MKYKFAVILSTIVLFIVAVILSFAWLLRTRYFVVNDLNGTTDGEAESEVYSFVSDVLEDNFKGKWIFSYGKEDVETLLRENPYVEIVEVKKSFPDKLTVKMSERKERFAISYGVKYYITDNEYNYLRSADQMSESEKDRLISVNIEGIAGMDFSSVRLGEKVVFKDADLFSAMTDIFGCFNDKLNFIGKIIVDGEKNDVDFYTYTGVVINVKLTVATTLNPTKEDIKNTYDRVCEKSKEIEKFYDSLDEGAKRSGYIRVFETESAEVKIIHEFPTENGETEGKNA